MKRTVSAREKIKFIMNPAFADKNKNKCSNKEMKKGNKTIRKTKIHANYDKDVQVGKKE